MRNSLNAGMENMRMRPPAETISRLVDAFRACLRGFFREKSNLQILTSCGVYMNGITA